VCVNLRFLIGVAGSLMMLFAVRNPSKAPTSSVSPTSRTRLVRGEHCYISCRH
jgi:hypothetical protein